MQLFFFFNWQQASSVKTFAKSGAGPFSILAAELQRDLLAWRSKLQERAVDRSSQAAQRDELRRLPHEELKSWEVTPSSIRSFFFFFCFVTSRFLCSIGYAAICPGLVMPSALLRHRQRSGPPSQYSSTTEIRKYSRRAAGVAHDTPGVVDSCSEASIVAV